MRQPVLTSSILHNNHSKQSSNATHLTFHITGTGNQIVPRLALVSKRPSLHNLQRANSSSSITAKQFSTYDDSTFEKKNNAVSDAELLKAVNEYEEATISEHVQFMQSCQTDSNTMQCMSRQLLKKMSPPAFSNCKIEGGIIINIHKD